ncbi:MAG: acyl carrier protein [Syntrophomonadaceae bacterium]
MENFCANLAEVLEVDEVHREDELDDFENWDSLGILEVVVMIEERYGVVIDSKKELKDLVTVGELEDLVKAKFEAANK